MGRVRGERRYIPAFETVSQFPSLIPAEYPLSAESTHRQSLPLAVIPVYRDPASLPFLSPKNNSENTRTKLIPVCVKCLDHIYFYLPFNSLISFSQVICHTGIQGSISFTGEDIYAGLFTHLRLLGMLSD